MTQRILLVMWSILSHPHIKAGLRILTYVWAVPFRPSDTLLHLASSRKKAPAQYYLLVWEKPTRWFNSKLASISIPGWISLTAFHLHEIILDSRKFINQKHIYIYPAIFVRKSLSNSFYSQIKPTRFSKRWPFIYNSPLFIEVCSFYYKIAQKCCSGKLKITKYSDDTYT